MMMKKKRKKMMTMLMVSNVINLTRRSLLMSSALSSIVSLKKVSVKATNLTQRPSIKVAKRLMATTKLKRQRRLAVIRT